ncbi:RPA2 family protein [Megaselia abdita]
MNDSFGAGGNFNASQVGSAPQEAKSEGMCPVLVRQLDLSADGNFQMWGMSFGMVTLVAIVREVETSSTKITYTLEDFTGRIDAHYWLEEGASLNTPDVMEGSYARVYGTVRTTGGKKTLMIFKLHAVNDPNEVNTHILEVLTARYKAEEYSRNGGSAPIGDGSGFTDFSLNKDSGGEGSDTASRLGLSGKHAAVFNAIHADASEEGIDRDRLEKKFSHISKSELGQILDYMVNEGHIYTSIDTDHFLATEV